jgi:hypothetical protein
MFTFRFLPRHTYTHTIMGYEPSSPGLMSATEMDV